MEEAAGESENVSKADCDECYETEKKLRRREQNRRAAQRFRDKERRRAITVMEEHKRYRSANTDLRYEIKILQKQKEILEETLHRHKERTCRLQKPVSDDRRLSSQIPAAHVVDNMNFYQSQETEGPSGFTHPSLDHHPLPGSEPDQSADWNASVSTSGACANPVTSHECFLPQTTAISSMDVTFGDSALVGRQFLAGFGASQQQQQPVSQQRRQQAPQQPTRQQQAQAKALIPTVVEMVESDEMPTLNIINAEQNRESQKRLGC